MKVALILCATSAAVAAVALLPVAAAIWNGLATMRGLLGS